LRLVLSLLSEDQLSNDHSLIRHFSTLIDAAGTTSERANNSQETVSDNRPNRGEQGANTAQEGVIDRKSEQGANNKVTTDS
jgi:hypothetical protein